jgi:sugar phosphate isomerase/epimerase
VTGPRSLGSLSLNQKTVDQWSVPEVVAGCTRHGIRSVGLWREPVSAHGLERTAKLVRDEGLRVSSLCRGGFLTTRDPAGRTEALADNRRAVDEAATLDADCLVLVVGGLPDGSRDLRDARGAVADALAELAPYAGERGVRLAIEPLHPMYCADRAVVSTLAQALDLSEPFPAEQVGVVVDTFHVWWDPAVWESIARAGDRIASYQVCDWILPLPADVLLARGYMGDGVIDFRPFTDAVTAAGYRGDIEVEIFNADVWASPGDEVLATTIARFREHVL